MQKYSENNAKIWAKLEKIWVKNSKILNEHAKLCTIDDETNRKFSSTITSQII